MPVFSGVNGTGDDEFRWEVGIDWKGLIFHPIRSYKWIASMQRIASLPEDDREIAVKKLSHYIINDMGGSGVVVEPDGTRRRY